MAKTDGARRAFREDAGVDATPTGATTATAAARVIVPLAPRVSGQMVSIEGFAAGEGGDRLDLGQFLSDFLPRWSGDGNPFAEGFAKLDQRRGVVRLFVDPEADGSFWTNPVLVLPGALLRSLTAYNLMGWGPRGAEAPAETFLGDASDDRHVGGLGGIGSRAAGAATCSPAGSARIRSTAARETMRSPAGTAATS